MKPKDKFSELKEALEWLEKTPYDVKRRDGSVSVGQSGGNVVWYHQGKPDDVVAFALTPEGDA